MQPGRWGAGALGVFWLAGTAAWAQAPMQQEPDIETGRELAEKLCSGCHLVGPQHMGPVPDAVPPFVALADQLPQDPRAAATLLLADPHPQMPEPPLTQAQLLDVSAYILSLKASR